MSISRRVIAPCLVVLGWLISPAVGEDVDASHAEIKSRYVEFLVGTEDSFSGKFGEEAAKTFLHRVRRPIEKALAFDWKKDAGKPFRAFPGEEGYKKETDLCRDMLQQTLPALAFGYRVKGVDNPYFENPEVLACYLRCLDYLHGRGIRDGMTFHNNIERMNAKGAPKPPEGAGNLVEMELRMGSLCQSVLLMEPFIKETETYGRARKLVRHLEMLGKTSGHTRYFEPYQNLPEFRDRVQSDAIQLYGDTTLVSALLESGTKRRGEMLDEARRVYTDSLKVIPGWADTIKPDFTGFHHRGIYGNAYTGGFIPQAAFAVWLLDGTPYAVAEESATNLKRLINTYRLYCQKYSMPFGIRGRMPLGTDNIKTQVFGGIVIHAAALGLDDAEMKPVFARLWDPGEVGLKFVFTGGRGKPFRGFLALDMLRQLDGAKLGAEPDPEGFWYKPYGGLAIHRRDDWMAAVKGYSKSIWDYENGERENSYGQYFSHGSLTIFAAGDPVSDVDSGYRLDHGWDWYRMPGTTAVHFPVEEVGELVHRRFSPETFLGGVSVDGRNGAFGMMLNQEEFGDGTKINLRARKSVFFVDDLIVMLGSGISGGDGKHPVETTLFQTSVKDVGEPASGRPDGVLVDAVGNGYFVADPKRLEIRMGEQKSFLPDGRTPSVGIYSTAWFDHGLNPSDETYEAAILVRGGERIGELAETPDDFYRVVKMDRSLHQVRFPKQNLTSCVFFEPGGARGSLISRVSDPCLVMVKRDGEKIAIGVANPDLGRLDPDSPVPDYKWISRNENQYRPSRLRPVEVELEGKWKISGEAEGVEVVSASGEKTLLRFDCLHGMTVRVELIQP